MNNKFIFLSTCDTCRKIMKALELPQDFERYDLKDKPIDKETLAFLYQQTGNYLDIVNKRSRKIKELGIVLDELTDKEISKLLLEHYTLIKRPITIVDGEAFIGNAKKTTESVKYKLSASK